MSVRDSSLFLSSLINMSDIRLWSKDLIREFLEIYKSHTCLWKIKSHEYKNKHLKENAYNKLVKFCKDYGMPDANRDFVVKKIQSLKGSFRKEFKKVSDSQRRGRGTDDIYQPKLWYYELLLFTKDQEAPTDSFTNTDEETEEFIEEEVIEDTSTDVEEQEMQEEKNKQNKKFDYTPTRKRKVPSCSQPEFVTVCADPIKPNSKDLTEFDVVGMNIAKKMAKMDPLQAIYTESIINNVLRRGLLNKLTEDTNLCDRCVEVPSSDQDICVKFI